MFVFFAKKMIIFKMTEIGMAAIRLCIAVF
nr:MAG TPA: hypothetical protein [Caudoviricetes sp.]DAZ21097.1 MAG TPA: hypothetical protein [Caudoviricetes sp.]